MNPFSDNFINYDELPIDFTDKFELQNHLPSPNSDSTGVCTNSVSPPYPIQQVHTFFDANDQRLANTDDYYYSYSNQDFNNGAYTEQESSLSDKSKRIQKRNAAKERTMNKKGPTVTFEGVDANFLPEGFDDPNLDEKSKRKMLQMVRNRISAQNSRDRKKNHLNNLEERNLQLEQQNRILLDEKQALVQEIKYLKEDNNKLYQDNQSLRQNNRCSSCAGGIQNDTNIQKDNEFIKDVNEEGIPMGGFSGLSSPRLARFSSTGKGFLGFFAFVALVSVVAVVNVQQQGNLDIQGQFSSQRVLDVDDGLNKGYGHNLNFYTNHLNPSISFMLTNIDKIKNQFELNYEPTFRSHFQDLALSSYISNNLTILPQVTTFQQNSIVEYSPNLRGKTQTIISQTLPVISHGTSNLTHTATLFCPSGLEFFENQNQLTNSNTDYTTGELDLVNAGYLQLLVPKSTITRYNTKNTITDIYGMPIESENRNDDGLLELWVKIFHMRELHSSY